MHCVDRQSACEYDVSISIFSYLRSDRPCILKHDITEDFTLTDMIVSLSDTGKNAFLSSCFFQLRT